MPRKTFVNGEVLTASDINTYLSNEQNYTSSTATSYTLQTADRYYVLNFSAGGTVTLTVGTATAFQAGERTDVTWGTATMRIVAGTGVTLNGRGVTASTYTSAQSYDAVSIVSLGSNTYRVIGNVTGA